MRSRPLFLLAQALYDVRTGMLFLPASLTVGLSVAAVGLTSLERARPDLFAWAAPLATKDPSSAQIVLGTVAASVMTVLSMTYSVLLMALSLASMQFSPRILAGFLKDQVSQVTLGLFAGTFGFALLSLRSVHGDPDAYVAPVGVVASLALAFACLGTLAYFVHHIAQGIQANYIVHRIASETRRIIDEEMPHPFRTPEPDVPCRTPDGATEIVATDEGYVQLVDDAGLVEAARAHDTVLTLVRAPGEFVVRGSAVAFVHGPAPESLRSAVNECLDLGPLRTAQQDVEFGLRQIVDIALKAISPAVNDPSTGVTCVDQLTGLLAYAAGRADPKTAHQDAKGAVRLHTRRTTFARLLDLATHQLRQYGKGDMAMCLRLARLLSNVAHATNDPARLAAIRGQAELLRASVSTFLPEESRELEQRLDAAFRVLSRGEAHT